MNEYVPEDDWTALQAVAVYADQHREALDATDVARIARVGDDRDGRVSEGKGHHVIVSA